jgi:adenosyl cobinamide kinase/adenosyl cobinamide phosphate guanylyltransferase
MGYVYMKRLCFVLLMCVLPMLGACAAPVYPRYQPIFEASFGGVPQQGHSHYQIDARTYLVTYQAFNPGGIRSGKYLSNEEWIVMAHDYVLYQAAELARSKGAKQFVILHRDDSNEALRVWASHKRPRGGYSNSEIVEGFTPVARVLIRMLSNDGEVNLGSENHVHEVDRLLEELIKRNAWLAAQLETLAPQEKIRASKSPFVRWRASVLVGDTDLGQALKKRRNSLLDTEITDEVPGVFGITLWSRLPLSAIDLLREGVKIAEREGYAAFRLEDWTVGEYRQGTHWNDWINSRTWFRTKARLVLQQQDEPNSLDPVFVVDEIRNNVMR